MTVMAHGAADRFEGMGVGPGGEPPVTSSPIFHATGDNSFGATTGPYSPGDMQEIDKAIRHMRGVVEYITKMAQKGVQETGSENFDVIVQNQPTTQRPRAYMVPINADGIHEELTEAVLLKAAVNLEGQGL